MPYPETRNNNLEHTEGYERYAQKGTVWYAAASKVSILVIGNVTL